VWAFVQPAPAGLISAAHVRRTGVDGGWKNVGWEEEIVRIVRMTGVEVEFACGLAGRVRWAREQKGYRTSSALDRVCVGMISRYEDRIAWLNDIRDAIDDLTREAG
jgi:hypothetical protein